MPAFHLPDETRISQVHLRTRDLELLIDFYTRIIGLTVLSREGQNATLSAPGQTEPLLVFSEDSRALARPSRSTGLFHVALRFPTRADLAHVVQRLIQHQYTIEGASNHRVSEAIYLSDPAGNGIELYTDLPRESWIWRDGQIGMSTEPLDFSSLLAAGGATAAPSEVPTGTDIGHIHLHVADLAQAERFFHEFLGMAVTQRSYPGALFFSAGGYHHHIGANTWAGKTVAPERSEGLLSYRLEFPGIEAVDTLRTRAEAFGYEHEDRQASNGAGVLAVREPNGAWLEISTAKENPAALRTAG